VFPNLSITARAVTFYLMALGLCAVIAIVFPSGEGISGAPDRCHRVAVLCAATDNPDAVAVLGREAGIATLAVIAPIALWISTWRTRTEAAEAQLVSV
jgi:hypothetical protein